MFKDGCMIFKVLVKTTGLLMCGGLVIGLFKIYQLGLTACMWARKTMHRNIFPIARRIVMIRRGMTNIKGIIGFSCLRLGWVMLKKEMEKKSFDFQYLAKN